jgi:glycosyltransferase EpsD
MKKVLYTATSDIHLATFHLPYIKWLKEEGYEVHLAMEKRSDIHFTDADKIFYLPFPRSPFSRQNRKTYQALRTIIDSGEYSLIHCHTPMPGVLTRMAARRARKKGAKVLYTAHGFHFFKGSPIRYWLTYFPIEYVLSYLTDGIVTINQEDYSYALHRLKPKAAFYIHGIGADNEKYCRLSELDRQSTRTTFGYNDGNFLLLYIAEFIHRKNHRFILEALPDLVKKIPSVRILFAGKGTLQVEMMELAKILKVESYVHFLGFNNNLGPIAGSVDLGISASRQEGLGLGLAEQMLCSIPVVATEDRGHRELIIPEQTGLMYPQNDRDEFVRQVVRLYKDNKYRQEMGKRAQEHALKFQIGQSLASMSEIYRLFLSEEKDVITAE